MTASLSETVEHDTSLLTAHARGQRARSTAKIVVATGAAALLVGLGIGFGAFGLSYLLRPQADIKMIGDQLVLNDVIFSDHLTGPRGETGATGPQGPQGPAGRDGINGRDGQHGRDGANIAPPAVGSQMSQQEFTSRPDYQASETHGVIKSIVSGEMLLDNGASYSFNRNNGAQIDWTETRFNGSPVYCRPSGAKHPVTGGIEHICLANVNGKIERVLAPLNVIQKPVTPREFPQTVKTPEPKGGIDLDPLDIFN